MTQEQDNSPLGDMAGEITKRDDGGPAFAAHCISETSGYVFQEGMTLRQWYAGMALLGVMNSVNMRDVTTYMPDYAAYEAFKIADAMIKESEK